MPTREKPGPTSHRKEIYSEVVEVSNCLWQKGWAERNAGNISINITDQYPIPRKAPKASRRFTLNSPVPALAGNVILVSGTGTRMRNVACNPNTNCCILGVGNKGDEYTILNDSCGVSPTSELPSHLAIHAKLKANGETGRAVLHTHPDSLIALSQISAFKDQSKLNETLWGMHPETVIVVPEGIGFVDYKLPGSAALADATVDALKRHRIVLWEKHGVVAVGKTLNEAFDLVDTVEKSARLFLQCKMAGYEPEGLNQSQLNSLKKAFLGL